MSLYTSVEINFRNKEEYESFKNFLSSQKASIDGEKIEIGEPALLFSTNTPDIIKTAIVFLSENKEPFIAALVALYAIWSKKESENSISVIDQDGNPIVIKGQISKKYSATLLQDKNIKIDNTSNSAYIAETINIKTNIKSIEDLKMDIHTTHQIIENSQQAIRNIRKQPLSVTNKISAALLGLMAVLAISYRELFPHEGGFEDLATVTAIMIAFFIPTIPIWHTLKTREKQREELLDRIHKANEKLRDLTYQLEHHITKSQLSQEQ